ncbi:hypothetical protein CR513_22196, partial [Mucuna pruriens]
MTTNYNISQIRWEIGLSLLGIVDIHPFEPSLQQGGADDAAQRKDQLALSQIHQGVDYSIFDKIANAKTAKEA